jgi:AraC-like DNA-binding protein
MDNAMLQQLNGIENLFNRLAMDLLTPLISHFSLSVKYYFSGKTCEGGAYDGSTPLGHLHVIKSGSLTVQLSEDQCISIDKPSVLFFPRPCAHSMVPGKAGVELVCGTVDLGITEQSPLANSLPQFIVIRIADMPSIGTALDLLYHEAFTAQVGRQTALDRLFEYFIIHVLRHLIAQGQLNQGALAAMADPRLAHAFNAMHEHPSRPWTLDELADLATMSRARFSANFRSLSGFTPLEYLTSWRLSVARSQLRQGRSLKSVARAVGYQSPEAFSRVFAKKIGKSPAEWMRVQHAGEFEVL